MTPLLGRGEAPEGFGAERVNRCARSRGKGRLNLVNRSKGGTHGTPTSGAGQEAVYSPPTVNGDFYKIGTLGLRDCMHSITVNVTLPIANEEILRFDRYRG